MTTSSASVASALSLSAPERASAGGTERRGGRRCRRPRWADADPKRPRRLPTTIYVALVEDDPDAVGHAPRFGVCLDLGVTEAVGASRVARTPFVGGHDAAPEVRDLAGAGQGGLGGHQDARRSEGEVEADHGGIVDATFGFPFDDADHALALRGVQFVFDEVGIAECRAGGTWGSRVALGPLR